MFFRKKTLQLIGVGIGAAMLCGADPLYRPVALTAQETAGVDGLKGRFYVAADPAVAWGVLTDYERIPRFVSSMKVSRIELREDPQDLLLTQEAEGGILFFTKRVHVLLKVHETPMTTIDFEDVDNRDFSLYRGSWTITPCPQGGVSVVYQLNAHRKFDVPLAGDAMNGGVRDLLTDVQKEIFYRQLLTGKPTPAAAALAPVIPTETPTRTTLK
jgi:hypothetical protein